MMMALGDFRFSLRQLPYQRWARSDSYGWVEQARLGRKPVLQNPTLNATSISLEGVLYPQWRGGYGQLDAMRAMADEGKPLLLISGDGKVFGEFIIESVEEENTIFTRDGQPKRQEFTINLKEYSGQ
ncbi:phage tail protein [Bartonella sp. DGB2]|uniref:phage tail protein n=1 Tax=Bartonella sp. DGB2 TaxID=3388426 RepID=UPI00398F98C8